MTPLGCSIVSYAVNSVWEIPLVGGAGWVASRWLKRAGSQTQHALWVVTLVLAVLAPALPVYRWMFGVVRSASTANMHSLAVFAADTGGVAGRSGVAVWPASLVVALLLCYLIALLYFTARLGWSLYWTARLLRDARPISLEEGDDELWRRCKEAFGLEDALILSSRQIAGPVTMGFRRPVLLVPDGFLEGCEPQDVLTALAHECAHMKRRDFRKNLVYEVGSLVAGFHPVVWMLKSQIAQTREMVCDGMAVERLIDWPAYTQSLLRLATMISVSSRVAPSHAIGIFDANILEERIMRMKTKKQPLGVAARYGLIVSGALLLSSVAAGGAAMTVSIEPQEASQAATDGEPYGHVYRLEKGSDVIAPKLISSTEPEFPASAMGGKDKFEGKCIVALIVDATGTPRDVHIIRPLGQGFDANAIDAVKQYRFKPAERLGEPVAVALKVEVNFQRF